MTHRMRGWLIPVLLGFMAAGMLLGRCATCIVGLPLDGKVEENAGYWFRSKNRITPRDINITKGIYNAVGVLTLSGVLIMILSASGLFIIGVRWRKTRKVCLEAVAKESGEVAQRGIRRENREESDENGQGGEAR